MRGVACRARAGSGGVEEACAQAARPLADAKSPARAPVCTPRRVHACKRSGRDCLLTSRPCIVKTQCENAGTACCAKCYEEFKEMSCEEIKADTSADDHYCRYVDWPEYQRVQTGGVITAIILAAIMAATILFRDIMKVWTCGGLTDAPLPVPDRQLTTMSAAYAAETMPGSVKAPEPKFQQTSAPMGSAPTHSPMMPMGYPGQPMMGQPMMGQPMGMGYGQPMMMR